MQNVSNERKYGANASYFRLSFDEVHLWLAELNQPQNMLDAYFSTLSSDEKNRASRFYFEKDRKHYIAGRGMLRALLGEYIGMGAASINFVYGEHGKPDLAPKLNPNQLQFNISHSKDMAVYAFSWQKKIGVDIEYVYPMKNMNEFAQQFFTPNECEFLFLSSAQERPANFFKIWTCKEAFLKANGSGLTVPINEVDTEFFDDGARLISVGADTREAQRWALHLLRPLDGYQIAAAMEENEKKIVLRKY